MNNDTLKEIGCYAGCIAFIAISAYFYGLFNEKSYEGFSKAVVATVKSTGIENLINKERSARKKVTVYKNYRPRIIPANVLSGSEASGTWRNIFNVNRKVIFYLFDDNDEFNTALYAFYSKNQMIKYYNFEPHSLSAFNNMLTGTVGPSKICNSMEECNKVREKASNYTLLTNFLSSCGKTMCVFNPAEGQYIRLKKRDIKEAEQMLQGLKNW